VDYFAKKNIRVPVFDSTEKFMPEIRKYTAVFCYTDYMLLDLYGKSEDAGIGIPKDISVIGYDNMDFVKYLKPSPATIHQHKTELGHAAGELLMKMLHNNKVDEKQIRFIPELIAGKSVGAASK
jgi:DNA-binding LacI/PurR family transcriptional regulator